MGKRIRNSVIELRAAVFADTLVIQLGIQKAIAFVNRMLEAKNIDDSSELSDHSVTFLRLVKAFVKRSETEPDDLTEAEGMA